MPSTRTLQLPPPPTSAPGAPPAPQPGYEGVVRTTPIVPATIETRNAHSAHPINPLERRHGIIQQIVQHCNTLWGFANKYAQTPPHMQPHPDELRDMHYFAGVVVHLLDDLRRLSLSEEQGGREGLVQVPSADESRPPKRPWEDMSRDDDPAAAANQLDYPDENSQTTAEQDMEIIRSKRATSSGTTTPGQPKSKYRKRSGNVPPATSEKRRNGGEDRTVPGHCAMRAGSVGMLYFSGDFLF
ncbi:hypothetical protein EW026_g3902 [Hermanssonia centrifuga]|uniref:Uncharacterized protein n=1 Tax=Hermanssonia centrifuga TaxID=98765 RepID=A0A4S4KKP0_9APHY|nr:hypothetical protein EW026_g3902 [Hermanssonia centrifuga]